MCSRDSPCGDGLGQPARLRGSRAARPRDATVPRRSHSGARPVAVMASLSESTTVTFGSGFFWRIEVQGEKSLEHAQVLALRDTFREVGELQAGLMEQQLWHCHLPK